MKALFFACCLLLGLTVSGAQAADADAELRQQVNAFVDAWHDDAAHARLAYFDKIAADGIYIGTDKSELWTREAFKTWAQKAFARKVAWAFKARRRNVYLAPDHKLAWFDELLDTQMGVCQASGVIRKGEHGLEIVHYQLSLAMPNALQPEVSKSIKAFEAKAPDQ